MRLCVVFSSLLLLTACGGGNTPNGEPSAGDVATEAASRGVLVLDEQAGVYTLDAWFTRLPEVTAAADLLWQAGRQNCQRISQVGLSDIGASADAHSGSVGSLWQQTLDAGSALEIRDRGGVVARMPAQVWGEAVVYATEERWLEEALSEDAYLHVPGSTDVPAFDSISLVPLAPLQVLAPEAGVAWDRGEAIEWQGSTNPADVIELTLTFADKSGAMANAVVCELEDDGRYQLPEAIQQLLPNAASAVQATLLRKRSTVYESGDATLEIVQLSRS